jgi:hypothetical protein
VPAARPENDTRIVAGGAGAAGAGAGADASGVGAGLGLGEGLGGLVDGVGGGVGDSALAGEPDCREAVGLMPAEHAASRIANAPVATILSSIPTGLASIEQRSHEG